jgi:zinc/manganese transport system substrate-binding protein
MKKHFFLPLLLTLAAPVWAEETKLNLFACEPEWAALAREIGGNKLEIYTATTAFQDPHHIEARPSLLAQARKADMLVCTGAELEAGWLPLLLQKTGNPKIQGSQPGYFMAAEQIERQEIPSALDRGHGDVHASGNPHVHTDPRSFSRIAPILAERLARIDPANADFYHQRQQDFSARWQQALQRWEAQAQPLRGLPIVVNHANWIYLETWLGWQRVATLEPKPGLPPTSGHLAEVLVQLQQKPAKLLIYAAYEDAKAVEWLSQKSGLKATLLPYTVGGSDAATDLFRLFDDTLQRLLEAAR